MKQHRSIAVILALVMTFSCSACAAKEEASSHTSVSESTAVSDTVSISDLSTRVTGANRDDYDFTEKALDYLTQIGENYPSRSISDKRGHDAFGDWLMTEFKSFGFSDGQIEEQSFLSGSLYAGPVKGRNIILTVPGQTDYCL
jgi:hypothetical protein